MSGKTANVKSRIAVHALAGLAVLVGGILITAEPARADHEFGGAGVQISFGLPFPFPVFAHPVPVPVPVPVYGGPVFYEPSYGYHPPYYRHKRHHWHREHARYDDWNHGGYYGRGHGRHGDWDDDD